MTDLGSRAGGGSARRWPQFVSATDSRELQVWKLCFPCYPKTTSGGRGWAPRGILVGSTNLWVLEGWETDRKEQSFQNTIFKNFDKACHHQGLSTVHKAVNNSSYNSSTLDWVERSDGEASRKHLSCLHIKFNLPPLSLKTWHSPAEKEMLIWKKKECGGGVGERNQSAITVCLAKWESLKEKLIVCELQRAAPRCRHRACICHSCPQPSTVPLASSFSTAICHEEFKFHIFICHLWKGLSAEAYTTVCQKANSPHWQYGLTFVLPGSR